MLIAPYDPAWAEAFHAEATLIGAALSPHLLALHHIGSTSVPGLHAKPIIDMLAVVPALDDLDAASPALAAPGYQVMGEYGIAGRRYFRKDDTSGTRTHHLHGYAAGSSHIERHLAFRDYLRAHPAKVMEYSALKQRLAANTSAYVESKAPFVTATQAEALDWYRQLPGH